MIPGASARAAGGTLPLIGGAALTLAVILVGAGTALGQPAPSAEPPRLPARLIYGGDRAFPPFEYLDEAGRPQGFNVELVRALASRLGIEVDFQLTSWPKAVARFERHEVDLVSLAYSDMRAERYALLPRTWTLDEVVLFRAGRPSYPDRLDLLQKEIVAVEADSVIQLLLGQLSALARPAFVPVESQRAALDLLVSGQATAVAGNTLTLGYWARHAGLKDLVSIPVKSVSYHLATQKDRAAALAPLAHALEEFRRDDGIDRLVERLLVLPDHAENLWHRYASYLGAGVLVAAVLLVGVFGWNRSLARVVERRTAELRESEERYRDLLENASDLIQSIDTRGRFIYVNRMWLQTLGYTREESRHLTLFDIVHPDSVEHCRRLFARVAAGNAIGTVRADFVSKTGRRITVEGSVNAKIVDGRVVATRAIFRDVSARQQAEDALRASEARLRSLVHNMLGGLITLDQDGRVETMNPAAERMFGYTAGELIGQHVSALIPERLWESSPAFLQQAFRDTIGRVTEWEGRRRNGECFPLELSFFEFSDVGGRHFAGNIRDISERREVDRLKNEFVSTVSHELRTPLTSIKGAMQLLLHDESLAAAIEQRQLVGVALHNTERLIRIVNDMLDIAKIEAGKLTLARRQSAVDELVRTSVQNVEQIAHGAGVGIAADVAAGLPSIFVDPDRMVQVLVNLLSNALKFAPEGSDVTIAARPAPGGGVSLSVRDRGRGIPPDQLRRLFRKFQQLDGTSARTIHGTGLGLAITKGLVEQHGGQIDVASTEGEGTSFTITLPAEA